MEGAGGNSATACEGGHGVWKQGAMRLDSSGGMGETYKCGGEREIDPVVLLGEPGTRVNTGRAQQVFVNEIVMAERGESR